MERGWKQCSRQGEEGPVKQEPFLLQAVLFFSFFSPSFSVFFFFGVSRPHGTWDDCRQCLETRRERPSQPPTLLVNRWRQRADG